MVAVYKYLLEFGKGPNSGMINICMQSLSSIICRTFSKVGQPTALTFPVKRSFASHDSL